MQKIMFNDKYGLTKAVLEGKKTQTRRILNWNNYIKPRTILCQGRLCVNELDHQEKTSRYSVGETVAIAQSLKELGYNPSDRTNGAVWGLDHKPAWTNKMYVGASQCKNQIRITNIRLQRLQDISDDDCLKEGIKKSWWMGASGKPLYGFGENDDRYTSPREAYAALIDKVSGKGTWERNPWVFVYDFELVK